MRGRNIEGYWRAAWMDGDASKVLATLGLWILTNIKEEQLLLLLCSLKCSASPEFAPLAFNHQIYPVRVYRLWLKMVLNSPVGMSRAFVLFVISNISPKQSTSEFPKSVCTSVFYILTTKSSNFDIVPKQIVMYCMYYTGTCTVQYKHIFWKNIESMGRTKELIQITWNRFSRMLPNYRKPLL